MSTKRLFYIAEFLAIGLLLAITYYLEKAKGILPCPLCEVQRILYAFLGGLFLLNSASKQGWRFVNVLVCLVALLGALLALRQVWLHYAPPQANVLGVCDISLSYLLQIMPLSDVLLNVVVGGPGCAKVTWQLFHLSIAEWSLIWFTLFFMLGIWKVLRP